MANSDNPDIESLLTVGVLEILIDEEPTFQYAMNALNDRGKNYLMDAKRFWHGKAK